MIVGISGDLPDNLKLFAEVEKLPYTLLSDDKGTVAGKFGVPVRKGGVFKYKGKDLKRGVTIARYTVVIDRAGRIAALDAVSNPAGEAKRVEAILKKLAK